MQLRDYQTLAVERIFAAWTEARSTLLVMATGLGKTVTLAEVIRRAVANGGRAMLLAHREELIWQGARKIKAVTGIECGIEMADYATNDTVFGQHQVVVGTVQTVGNRLAKFDPDEFSVVVVDEAHHAVAQSYTKILKHFGRSNILGVTATPDRADEAALGKAFESVAHVYEILDGINDGWLTPIEQQTVHVEDLDLSNVRTTAGDLNGADLARVLETEKALHEIAGPTYELADGRKTLVFAASVAQAERLAEILNRHQPGSAQWISGETPKEVRRRLLRGFADGAFQFLVNCAVLTEGFDEPSIEVVAVARPTKSRALYAQIVGRGTRPLDGIVDQYDDAEDRRMAIAESAKPSLTVLDFEGNAGRHKLMTCADILGGNFEDAVVSRAKRKASDAGKSVNMIEALKEAAAELHAEREAQRLAEAAKRQRLVGKATYQTQKVNPFDVFHIEPPVVRGWDFVREPTPKMKALLEKQGIDPAGMSIGEAGRLITEITQRWDKGQASFKQAKLLQKYGLPGDVSRDQAKEWIDKIKDNNWRLPSDLKQAAADPAVEALFT